MRYTIDTAILEKYGLDLTSFLFLWFKARKGAVLPTIELLSQGNWGYKSLYDSTNLILGSAEIEKVDNLLLESEQAVVNKDEFFEDVADALQALYPTGKKPGTTYMWRSTKAEIVKKLKLLVVKYHYTFTKEQAVEATKAYINSFNGNYKLMRVLKYFILKTTKDDDGNANISSGLMEYIENKDTNNDNEWTSTLV